MIGKPPVVIVGGGVMGAAAAYWLAQKGRQVTLLDQHEIPNQFGASGDHLRVFRLTYGKDAFYTELAAKTLPLWLALNLEGGEPLLVQNGMLELATQTHGYEEQSYAVLKDMNLPVAKVTKEQMNREYPMINSRAVKYGVLHKDGGMIWATRATSMLAHLAQRRGAKLKPNTRAVSILRDKTGIKGVKDAGGKTWVGQDYLFTPGAWTTELLKTYKIPLKITKQQQLYLRPPANRGRYRPEHFPVFAALTSGFYGFPLHIHGFLKIGDHTKGPAVPSPYKGDTNVTPQFINKCRAFLKRYIPELASFTEMEGKVGYYTNTKDDDFILDRLPDAPNGYIAAGFSGHGFKFAPLIGKIMADMICGAKPEVNLHRFRIARLRR